MGKQKCNKTNKEFNLNSEPVSYQISLHMQNLMATYGQEVTLKIIKGLFFSKQETKKQAANG